LALKCPIAVFFNNGYFLFSGKEKKFSRRRHMKEIYADMVSAVHVTGNMIRIDLMTLQPQLKSDTGEPVFELTGRVILPLDAFAQGFRLQESIVQQLMEKGILIRQEPQSVQA
jgi:hypothetical protein